MTLKSVLGQTADDFKKFLKQPGHSQVKARKALKLAVTLFDQAVDEIVRLEVEKRKLEEDARVALRADIDSRRGLFPYVDAIERLNRWLETEPELAKGMEPIMRQLEIWQIKVNPGIRERLTGTTEVPSPSTGWNRLPVLSKADAQEMLS